MTAFLLDYQTIEFSLGLFPTLSLAANQSPRMVGASFVLLAHRHPQSSVEGSVVRQEQLVAIVVQSKYAFSVHPLQHGEL